MALFLTEQDVTRLLTMEDALSAVESVMRAQASGAATNEPRRRVRISGTTLHVMSGAVADLGPSVAGLPSGLLGLKAYTVARGRARFHVSLYDAASGELLALLEADRLGQMRTGAASGVATKYLARHDASRVGLYGAGWQAESQLEAIALVRAVRAVKVYSRRAEHRQMFAQQMGERLGLEITPVDAPGAAAEGAEILITITTSREPVLSGSWIEKGAHINAVGGNSLLRRELDDEAISRADLIAVDSIDQAKLEAGELVAAFEKGLLNWERVCELRHIVGRMAGRQSDQAVTLFKSLGLAIEDIATAAVVYQRARQEKLGREI
jgi:ornithine cyclodeaminase/alanine dehydrogenase